MAKIIRTFFFAFASVLLLAFLVLAVNYDTTFNPFTGSPDFVNSLNQSGGNITADYFFGNGSSLQSVCLSNGSFCTASVDTNETVRFNNLVNASCGAGFVVFDIYDNGTVACVADANSAGGNTTDEMRIAIKGQGYYNETRINTTVLINQSGILGIVYSYFSAAFIELTDLFGGEVSGTYDNLQIYNNSITLTTSNITNYFGNTSDEIRTAVKGQGYYNETRINTTVLINQSGVLGIVYSYFSGAFIELLDSFGGDVSGTFGAIAVLPNSTLLDWENITAKPTLVANSSSVTFTTVNVTVKIVSADWSNVTANSITGYTGNTTDEIRTAIKGQGYYNETRINTTSLRNESGTLGVVYSWVTGIVDALAILLTDSFGGEVSGTYDNLQIYNNSITINTANITNYFGNTSAEIQAVAVGGDLSGTVGTAAVITNSVLSHYDNLSNVPAFVTNNSNVKFYEINATMVNVSRIDVINLSTTNLARIYFNGSCIITVGVSSTEYIC